MLASTPAAYTEDSNKLYVAGVALAKEGKLDQAITTFENALESDGHNRLLLNATGAAYSLRGNFEQAKGYFLKCLEEDSEFVPARKNRKRTAITV